MKPKSITHPSILTMKQIFRFVLLALVVFPALATAQVVLSSSAGSFLNIPTNTANSCSNSWYPLGNVILSETNNDDFPGASGSNGWSMYSVYVRLAPGFKLNPTTVAWAITSGTNADLDQQTCSGTGANLEFVWDDYSGTNLAPDAAARNTVILHVRGKNSNKKDQVTISGLQVQLIPGANTVAPNNYVYVKAHHDCGQDPAIQYGASWVLRGMAPDTWYYLTTCATAPVAVPGTPPSCVVVMNALPGAAASMYWVVQPKKPGSPDNYPFDFESEVILGSGGPYPAVQYVDCAGYLTSQGPAGNSSGNVTGVLMLDPGTTPANPNVLFSGSLSVPVVGGKSEFNNLVMAEPGQYRIKAVSGALTATSEMFEVAARTMVYQDDPAVVGTFTTPPANIPVFGLLGGAGNPVLVLVKNVHGTAVNGVTVVASLTNKAIGNSSATLNGFLSQGTVLGVASFSGLNIFPYRDDATVTGFSVDFTSTIYRTGTTVDARYITNPLSAPLNSGTAPVELVSFNAVMRNNVVTLKWRTATEVNNHGFDIERSSDRAAWEKIGFVQGAGTSNTPNEYSFKDDLAAQRTVTGAVSYRLVQQDRDGKTTPSQVVTVSVTASTSDVELMQNYPNPFNPTTNISFNLPSAGPVTLAVFNELGVEVARLHDNTMLEAGLHTASFNASSLPSGLYTYRLTTANGSDMKRMIVTK